MLDIRKINMKKIIKQIGIIILGIIIGYLIYYSFVMEIIPYFIGASGFKYILVSISSLIISILGCILVINLLVNKKIDKWLFIILCITYFAVLTAVLFIRKTVEKVFILNPLVGLFDTFTEVQSLLQSLMNIIMFIPIGYFLKGLKYWKASVTAIVIPILIEFLQFITMRGFFDSFDIILYFIGINIGYFLFRKVKIKIE